MIPSSVSLPRSRLREHTHELPSERELVAHCRSGYRTAIAASLLLRDEFPRVADLVGGMAAWRLETV